MARAASFELPLFDEPDPAELMERIVDECAAGRVTSWPSVELALYGLGCTPPTDFKYRCTVAAQGSGRSFHCARLSGCFDPQMAEAMGATTTCRTIECTGKPRCVIHGGGCRACSTAALIGLTRCGKRVLPLPTSFMYSPVGADIARMFRAACEAGHIALARDIFATGGASIDEYPSNQPMTVAFELMARPLRFNGEQPPHIVALCAAAEAGLADVVVRLLRRRRRGAPRWLRASTALFHACLGWHRGLAQLLIARYKADTRAGFFGACAAADPESLAEFDTAGIGDTLLHSHSPAPTVNDVGFRFAVVWADDLRFAERLLASHRLLTGENIIGVITDLRDTGRHKMVYGVVEMWLRRVELRPGDADAILQAVAACRGASSWLFEAVVLLILNGADPTLCTRWGVARRLPPDAQRRLIARGFWPPGGTDRSLREFCVATRWGALDAVSAAADLSEDVILHGVLPYLW